jgi:hypothetical protein
MGEESKKTLTIVAEEIHNEPDDEKLGRKVREMMRKKIEEIDNHSNYIKSLEDGKH